MGQENQIVACLADRIRKAHLAKENFKIIVMMPLLPGFEGEITAKENGPLRVQVHNQYDAIKRGENSLYARLKDLENFEIDDYIFFFGLRTSDILDNKPITEIIYVHSKLMIVDDKRCIIGSANINDRSLLGLRDSELAIVVEENNGKIDGPSPKGGIYNLRCRVFDEHFALNEEETSNINHASVWGKIIHNAKNNTLIYRRLFGCYPDNTITVGDEVEERVQEAKPEEYEELKKLIYGHAVELPLDFMMDENLEFQGLAGSFPEMFL